MSYRKCFRWFDSSVGTIHTHIKLFLPFIYIIFNVVFRIHFGKFAGKQILVVPELVHLVCSQASREIQVGGKIFDFCPWFIFEYIPYNLRVRKSSVKDKRSGINTRTGQRVNKQYKILNKIKELEKQLLEMT